MTNVTTLPVSKKTCSRCKQEQPVSNFDQDKSVKSTGLRSQCKTCRSELRKTYNTKPRSPRPKSKPAKKYSQAQLLKQQANREAILRLINNHRAEFNSLVYSEQVRLGVITPGERRDLSEVPSWVSLA